MKNKIKIFISILFTIFVYLYNFNVIFATESKDTPKLSEGVYTIKSALNERFVFDIEELSKNNGGNLQLWSNAKSDNQKFKIKYLGQDRYTISPVHSGKYIDLDGSSKKIGTNVMQWQYHGASNQQWIIKDAGNGYFNIISKCSGLYLDIPRSDCKDGANVQVWEKNNCKNQMFKFEKVTTSNPSTPSDPIATGGKKTIANGTYSIKSVSNNKVLDVNQSSMANGGNVGFWANGSTANQKFSVTYIGNGYYSISAQHSGKYIKKSDNANVNQGEYNGKNEEQWIIKEAGNGYYNIILKANSQYLTQTTSGNAEISKANNSNNQKFKFEVPTPMKGSKTISDGTYIIASGLNNNLVLDIPRSSKQDGEILEIWNNGRTDNQKFEVKYIGDGYYTIKAKHSGKVIDVMGANKVIGTKVQQYTSNSTDAQKWIIKEAGNGYYYIISKCSELSMDVTNAEASNGAKIQMYTINYTNAQKFKFINPAIPNIDNSKYPGYAEAIEKLKIAHPNWNFEMLYTGLKFTDAVSGEAKVHSRNLVEQSNGGEWVCTTCGTKLYDSGWYCASEKAIAYYLDPRNFLDEVNVFQFLDVNNYGEGSCTIDGIKKKINGTFLENYANDVNNACKNTNVNPYYIISRLLQEQGTKGTQIGKGMDGGDGKTYYNPFNIGASGNGYENIYANALARAKKEGWDSMQKAIEGGIAFCKKNWLENYQNTLYQNKFDIDTRNGSNLYEHQYMQNLLGAYSEARTLQSMYANTGKIDSNFTFIIPVYEKMDSKVSEKPSNNSETYPMNVQVTGNDVRLRQEANTNSKILKEMSKGTILLSIQRGINSNWQKVIASDGTIGYVSGTYLKQIDDIKTCNYNKKVKTNDGSGCYIRFGPGLNAPKMGGLPENTSVRVIDDSTYKNIDGYDWYRIVLEDGRQAFMPSRFLN